LILCLFLCCTMNTTLKSSQVCFKNHGPLQLFLLWFWVSQMNLIKVDIFWFRWLDKIRPWHYNIHITFYHEYQLVYQAFTISNCVMILFTNIVVISCGNHYLLTKPYTIVTTIVDDEWKQYLLNSHNHIETMQLLHPCVVDLCLIYLRKKLLQVIEKLSVVKHVASISKAFTKLID